MSHQIPAEVLAAVARLALTHTCREAAKAPEQAHAMYVAAKRIHHEFNTL